MSDFLLELLSEEIPARMQAKASADLARLFAEQLALAGLVAESVETHATPRRLALIARNLPADTAAVSEEIRGPRANAPSQALEGFLRKTGLNRAQLIERDGILFAQIEKPGRATASVLAEAIPAIVRAFPWPKSMRWGSASVSTESPRWVRPLQGIVALLGEDIVEFEIAGIRSGAATVGHRFHHPGIITIGGAHDYAEKLRACHVIVDAEERARLIREGAAAAASAAGLTLVEDEALIAENAGLTEWPVPLLGRFDPAYLDVPREVIQLTMRTNQKYFACLKSSPAFAGEGDHAKHGGGASLELAPNFICTANIEASDGGAAIVAGNERVLSARLADAKFFWEQDLKVPLEEQAKKLDQIVFHEKLGTVADKVDRVAKLARWLVEEGIVKSSPGRGGGPPAQPVVEGGSRPLEPMDTPLHHQPAAGGPPPHPGEDQEQLATLAETAARLCKADLVTGLVGEFPELQGVIGGHLARAQGLDPQIADAIRDHYKPVGQGDDVPTAPVTVAVSLADKLDNLVAFQVIDERPTGSRDPFALRRAGLAWLAQSAAANIQIALKKYIDIQAGAVLLTMGGTELQVKYGDAYRSWSAEERESIYVNQVAGNIRTFLWSPNFDVSQDVIAFLTDRLKVQQREAGVRHDLIDAVFALGGEDDLVRLLARVKALQAFVESPQGADLLAGYKRAANILKKEGWGQTPSPQRGEGRVRGSEAFSERPSFEPHPQTQNPLTQPVRPQVRPLDEPKSDRTPPTGEGSKKPLSYTPINEEQRMIDALDSAGPRAAAAIAAEDFEGAMAALASLRAPVDAFFDKVIVNDPDPVKRDARLALLARMRDAVHAVADFSRIEG